MLCRIQFVVYLLLPCLSVCWSAEAPARKWTDSTGSFTIDAEFVELVDDQVTLKTTDGRMIRVPLQRLGQSDHEYIQSRRSFLALEPDLPSPPSVPQPESASENLPEASKSDTESPLPGTSEHTRNDKLRTVVAEGVGLTPEDALKAAGTAEVF
jgi:hypothetical protein